MLRRGDGEQIVEQAQALQRQRGVGFVAHRERAPIGLRSQRHAQLRVRLGIERAEPQRDAAVLLGSFPADEPHRALFSLDAQRRRAEPHLLGRRLPHDARLAVAQLHPPRRRIHRQRELRRLHDQRRGLRGGRGEGEQRKQQR